MITEASNALLERNDTSSEDVVPFAFAILCVPIHPVASLAVL